MAPQKHWRRDETRYGSAVRQLLAYFEGELTTFDLPIKPAGTAFQNAVWSALQEIPYGKTMSYSQIAAKIDRSKAIRAVGAANGANPLPIVIPCHRLIGKNGALTGFGGGLPAKEFLLGLERGNTERIDAPAQATKSY